MDVKCKFENLEALTKVRDSYKKVNFPILIDENLPAGIAQIVHEGHVVISGLDNVKNYLKYGFNRIIQNCPYKFFKGKCSGESCQKYMVDNGTGDCSDRWVAVLTAIKFFTNNNTERN